MDSADGYNPLTEQQLAESVVRALESRPCVSLPLAEAFEGSGIYCLYYLGDFRPYLPLAKLNRQGCEIPVYFGRAKAPGGRKGSKTDDTKPSLFGRIREHVESIQSTSTLDIKDFRCRYLLVGQLWVPLAEDMMLRRYAPLWNKVLDGFGNHAPGSGRYEQERSRWDVLHPGRKWAERLRPNRLTKAKIIQLVSKHFHDKEK